MPDRTIASYFNCDSSPPAEQVCDVLAHDDTGEYQLPFPCQWREGAWYPLEKTKPLAVKIIGWRIAVRKK